MNAKVFGVGVGLFLILMSQLVVIYHEGQISAALEIVARNQKILNANQVWTVEVLNIQDTREVIDSLRKVDVSKLSKAEKKAYIARLDEIISSSLRRKTILDSVDKAIHTCNSFED